MTTFDCCRCEEGPSWKAGAWKRVPPPPGMPALAGSRGAAIREDRVRTGNLEIDAAPVLFPIAVARGIQSIALRRRPLARRWWRCRCGRFPGCRCLRGVLLVLFVGHAGQSKKKRELSHRMHACAAGLLLT